MKWSERFNELVYNSTYRDMECHVGVLYSIARGIKAKICVEFGVRTGDSTLAILHGIRDSKSGGKLFSVDMNTPAGELEAKVTDDKLNTMWSFHKMGTQDFAGKYFDIAQNTAGITGIGLLFLDADHEYSVTKLDITAMASYVLPGGYIIMHDTYSYPNGAGKVAEEVKWQKVRLDYSNGLTIIKRPDDITTPLF